jgi:hypothetical protein
VTAYPAPAYDATTWLGMLAITLAVVPAAAWVFAAGRGRDFWAWLAAGASVMALGAVLAASGLLAHAAIKPPLLQVLIVAVLLTLLWHGWRRGPPQAAGPKALAWLVLLQGFRLPLELLMLHAAMVGVMPVEFSMAGYNFDVATGALALPLGLALWRGRRVPRAWLWAWNLWGISCLCVVIVLAILTSPNVAFFGRDTRHLSVWVLHFPYVWLPTVLVGIAVYGHLALSLRLLGRPLGARAGHTQAAATNIRTSHP